ncbi:hypothetical protein [Polyangium sp. y55x31]|uniref:hypothetical protein n=1 Tax=Polyangium sp. y55x31 TaxID=3042688 RepID=UPI00248321E3|nr:hypothetical protein [Polyangium sp. y55x31]MDI1479721.1 hypothetical protein [Polyangium sp. y55x31]
MFGAGYARSGYRLAALFVLGALSFTGCGTDEPSVKPGGTGDPPPEDPRLSGTLLYETVAYDVAADGLDYSKVDRKPIRGARVALLDAANDSVLAETTSDAMGRYGFDWEGTAAVKVWVYAETMEPSILVVDNTASDATYVLESAEVVADEPTSLDVVATTGWTGVSYGKPRLAAPFSVLDAAYTAARRFLDETTPPPVFPKLEINWSVENRPEDGLVAFGQIGTSHWDGDQIYVLGKENVDTDEFDTHVLVHEWGHSFEEHITRSDSWGGSHGFGDVLDPRLAFSEGFCNALSAMILDPDSVYTDSMGPGQKDGFSEDIEKNDTSESAKPGWYSETTVQNVVFDAYDGNAEAFDGVELKLQGVYSVLIGDLKSTPAMTTLFPFVAGLKSAHPEAATAIDALVAHHGAGSSFGVDPVADAWGTGETHAADDPGALPVFVPVAVNESVTLTLIGGLDPALLGQNRFLRVKGTGGTLKVSSSSTSDVDLYVYLRGKELDNAESTSGDETVSFSTTAGEDYVVNVAGYGEISGPYEVKIEVLP